MPTNPQQFYDLLTKLLQKVGAPPGISIIVAWVFILIIILLVIWGILTLANKIMDSAQNLVQKMRNRDPETRRRIGPRQRFAGHIEREMERIGSNEEWGDYKFTELEAEVEAEGHQRAPSVIPFLTRVNSGLRRETSLSKALKSSSERLILVEGEPGSGKTIALRHVAQTMATEAKRNQSPQSIIPIYVNLKELERHDGEDVDRNLIESFILKSINRANDRRIEEFMEDEFKLGQEVIASRVFRGPTQLGWPRFRIVPLSEARQLELITKAELEPELENALIGHLANANPEIRSMATNPLFLSLLCEHMKSGHRFPDNVHVVFETYVDTRLNRDKGRLERRYGLNTAHLRAAAENIAFCMASDLKLGLSPTRNRLQTAMGRLGMEVDDRFETFLDALEYIRLARSEVAADATHSPTFTFAHRRFQEYFATCIVLREPSRVSPERLLTDARWRETAVVLCQTQKIVDLTALMDEVQRSLKRFCCTTQDLIDDPVNYVCEASKDEDASGRGYLTRRPFLWPAGSLHLLGILQDGFGSRLSDLLNDIRMYASQLVLSAMETGTLPDKKWALEAAGIAPEPILAYMLRTSFEGVSQWLKEVAYRQAARLGSIPPTIAKGIRIAIVGLANHGRLQRERRATKAHLERLGQSAYFLSIMRLLLWLPTFDLGLHIFLSIGIIISLNRLKMLSVEDMFFVFVILLISHLCLRISLRTYSRWILSGITVRLICLTILILVLSVNSQSRVLPWAILYVGLWGYLGLAAAYWGHYTGLRWWFLLPIWPFLYLLTNPHSVMTLLRRYIFNRIVMGVLLVEGAIMLILLLLSNLWSRYVTREFLQLSKAGLLILAMISIVGVIGFGLVLARRWMSDWFLWQKWLRTQQGYITVQILCTTVNNFYHAAYCTRVIRNVRERHRLVPTSEEETLLVMIARALEIKQVTRSMQWKQRNQAMSQKSIYSYLLIPLWFLQQIKETREIWRADRAEKAALEVAWSKEAQGADLSSCVKLVFRVEPEILDELYMLLEQIRIAGQDEALVAT